MTVTTLRTLINEEFKRGKKLQNIQESVNKLLDLFELDVHVYFDGIPTKPVTYADICSCNPKNGGGGVCGCTIALQPVIVQGTTTTSTTDKILLTENQ
jgi:hypothetical protein